MMDVLIVVAWITLGAFFGMLVTSLCVASGRFDIERENVRLRSELHKLQHEKATTPYPIEGAD